MKAFIFSYIVMMIGLHSCSSNANETQTSLTANELEQIAKQIGNSPENEAVKQKAQEALYACFELALKYSPMVNDADKIKSAYNFITLHCVANLSDLNNRIWDENLRQLEDPAALTLLIMAHPDKFLDKSKVK